MNNSSAQPTYSITLDSGDTMATAIPSLTSSDIITLDLSNVGAAQSTYVLSGSDTITLSGLSSEFNFKFPEEWIDSFPNYSEVEKMCKEYPALQIAFDRFKEIYIMVHDDWEAKNGKKYQP